MSNSDHRPVLEALVEYAEAGWARYGVAHEGDKKHVNTRVQGENRYTHLVIDYAKARKNMEYGYNVTVYPPEGWFVIDFDERNYPTDPDTNEKVDSKAALLRLLGRESFDDCAVVTTATGGEHVYFRLPEGVTVDQLRGNLDHTGLTGIDIKQAGDTKLSLVIAAGSYRKLSPQTGAYYRWTGKVRLKDTASAEPKLVELIVKATRGAEPKKARTITKDPGDPSIAEDWSVMNATQLRQYLPQLDPTHFRDYASFRDLLMSMHWLSGGDAECADIVLEWAAADPLFADIEHQAKNESLWRALKRPDEIDARTAIRGGPFRTALKKAGVARKDLPGNAMTVISRSRPLETARKFIEARFRDDRMRRLLVRHGRSFYHWKDGAYHELDQEHLQAWLQGFLEGCFVQNKDGGFDPFDPRPEDLASVEKMLRGECETSSTQHPPFYLRPSGNLPDPADLLAAPNGAIDLRTGELLPHDPNLFTLYAIDFEYDPDAGEPTQLFRFLESVGWAPFIDGNDADCLQEMLGYLLSPDTSQQKMFFIKGPTRSGKGVIESIIRGIVGEQNIAASTIYDIMKDGFALEDWWGRAVAIFGDIDDKIPKLGARAESVLKTISGEGVVRVARKFKMAVSCVLPTRIMMFGNHVPKFEDASGALAHRFIAFEMTRSFLGKEDLGLKARLRQERPQILRWAIEGRRRLWERGRFEQPDSGAYVRDQILDISQPLSDFVREWCVKQPGSQVEKDNLYAAYRLWCAGSGRDKPKTKSVFLHELYETNEDFRSSRPRKDGDRSQVVTGLVLKPEKAALVGAAAFSLETQ